MNTGCCVGLVLAIVCTVQMVAVLLDGPLAGRRVAVQLASKARAPRLIDVDDGCGHVHVYAMHGATGQARRWNYTHRPASDAS